jgi:hypothetical protein
LFYWKGQNTLAATTGTDPTFTRATAATFEDFEGLIKTVESSEPRFQGARRVENLTGVFNSENTTGWTGYGSAGDTVTHDTVDFPAGTSSSTKYVSSSTFQGSQIAVLNFLAAGNTYTISYFAKGAVGGETVWVNDSVNAHGSQVITSSWARYSKTFTQSVARGMAFGNKNAGQTVNFSGFLIENVTGQTNQNPSEYVSTGVGTGPELVTNGDFASGAGWTPQTGWTISGGSANCNLSNTYAGVYQSINVVAGHTYVITFDITSLTSGGIQVAINNQFPNLSGPSVSGLVALAVGTYTGIVTASTTGSLLFICRAANGFVGSVDNISVKQAEHGANVDGVEYFNTLNGNTVTANVVTEAVGSPLTRANTQFGELHGVGTDYFSTPNVVTTWGELDIRARATVDSIPNSLVFLADKQNSFFLGINLAGANQKLYFRVNKAIGGDLSLFSANFPTSVFGVRNWYRATYDAATGDFKFFTADGNLEAPSISDYVQLGPTQNSGAAAIAVTTASFVAGTWAINLTTYPFDGDIYRAQVFNEIDGTTPVVDFTPGSYVSGSTLVSSTSGETWTLVGNASIFQPPVDASGPFGYLAEKASTNLALQSEDFTTTWTAQNASVVANVAVAPDGTTTMDRLAVDTSFYRHIVYQQPVNPVGTTNYTASVYMKDDGAGFGGLTFSDAPTTAHIAVVVDLSTGLVTDTSVGTSSGTIVASGCEDVGNGVYRVWVSGTLGVSANAYIFPFTSNAAVPAAWTGGAPEYTGVTGEDILVWGVQLELGTYPTSYIPTTTTAVTRNADVLIAGDMVTDAAGTAYAEISSNWSTAIGTNYQVLVRDVYGQLLSHLSVGQPSTAIWAYDGVNQSFVGGANYYKSVVPAASTWGNALTAYLNGSPDLSPAAYDGTMGTGNLGIGNTGAGIGLWDGTIRHVKILSTELTAAEVAEL